MTHQDFLKQHRKNLEQAFIKHEIKRFSHLTPKKLKDIIFEIEKNNEIFQLSEVSVKDDSFNENAIRIYTPNDIDPDQEIVFFHSGGFVTGGLETSHQLCLYLAQKTNYKVYSFNYPKSPKVHFPEHLKACVDFINSHVSKKLIISGISAGANLALSSFLNINEKKKVAKLLLINGHYQNNLQTNSYKEFRSGEKSSLSTAMAKMLFKESYGEKILASKNPYAFPFYAKLNELPKTIIIGAFNDILRDDSRILWEKIKSEKHDFFEFENSFHASANHILEIEDEYNDFEKVIEKLK